MTAFWISTGLLTLLVLAVLCWPLLRRHGGAGASRKAINTAIYRDQLAELERDLASGVLSQADYGSARDELERRVLEDDGVPFWQRRFCRPKFFFVHYVGSSWVTVSSSSPAHCGQSGSARIRSVASL